MIFVIIAKISTFYGSIYDRSPFDFLTVKKSAEIQSETVGKS